MVSQFHYYLYAPLYFWMKVVQLALEKGRKRGSFYPHKPREAGQAPPKEKYFSHINTHLHPILFSICNC